LYEPPSKALLQMGLKRDVESIEIMKGEEEPWWLILTLILPRSHTGTVWFYTSTSNKRAA